jgi:hypothetical protein
MYPWQKAVMEAKTLPPGHIGKEIAKQLVQQEYGKCTEIEKKWCKRLNKFKLYKINFNEIQSKEYCDKICQMIGEKKKVKKVILFSNEVSETAGAHYDGFKKEIHFKTGFWFTTLIHELAHHCSHGGHGDNYCLVLDIIWSVVYTELTGKPCNDDWI